MLLADVHTVLPEETVSYTTHNVFESFNMHPKHKPTNEVNEGHDVFTGAD